MLTKIAVLGFLFTMFSLHLIADSSNTNNAKKNGASSNYCLNRRNVASKIIREYIRNNVGSCSTKEDCIYIKRSQYGLDLNKNQIYEHIAYVDAIVFESQNTIICRSLLLLPDPTPDDYPPDSYECINKKCVAKNRTTGNFFLIKNQIPLDGLLKIDPYNKKFRETRKKFKNYFDDL